MADTVQRARIVQLILERYGAAEEHPFRNDPVSAVFRCSNNQKWFAVMMRIPKTRLGLASDGTAEILNLKCGQILAGSLQRMPGFKAYHMNKDSWITILLDGTVPDEQIAFLLDISRESVSVQKKASRKAGRSRL